MGRINVYDYPGRDEWDEPERLVGWFDDAKATSYGEDAFFDGVNTVSRATGTQYDHERLYRTSGGRWVLTSWSQRQGAQDRAWYVNEGVARDWLLRNDYSNPDIAAAIGQDVPDESPEMGRPTIGPQVKVRLRAETIEAVDSLAAQAGVTRSEWIRRVVELAAEGRPNPS